MMFKILDSYTMESLKLFYYCLIIFQFEDSDVGVEDVYNTVEIETSDTDMVKDDCVIISSQPDEVILSQPDEIISSQPDEIIISQPSSQPPSFQSSSTTMKNSIHNQGILIINPLTSKLNLFP